MTPLDFLRTIGTDRTKTTTGLFVCRSIQQDATSSAVYDPAHGVLTLQSGHPPLGSALDVLTMHGRSRDHWTLCLYDHEDGLWSTSADPTPKPLAAIAATLPLPFRVTP
jgi:hypothetical protein